MAEFSTRRDVDAAKKKNDANLKVAKKNRAIFIQGGVPNQLNKGKTGMWVSESSHQAPSVTLETSRDHMKYYVPSAEGLVSNKRSIENQNVNDPMNMTVDPNVHITGSDGVHQQPINPNAQIVRSDGGQTPVGHVPLGHVPVGHTVIGQFSVPLGKI
ncbi:hypothetical protein AgCh_024077 [Apium graveolens]